MGAVAAPDIVLVLGGREDQGGDAAHDGVAADDATRKALQEHVKAVIAPYKYPRRIEFRDALPRTETGKLQRFRLRTIAAG